MSKIINCKNKRLITLKTTGPYPRDSVSMRLKQNNDQLKIGCQNNK